MEADRGRVDAHVDGGVHVGLGVGAGVGAAPAGEDQRGLRESIREAEPLGEAVEGLGAELPRWGGVLIGGVAAAEDQDPAGGRRERRRVQNGRVGALERPDQRVRNRRNAQEIEDDEAGREEDPAPSARSLLQCD